MAAVKVTTSLRGRCRPRAIFSGKARTKLVIIVFVDRAKTLKKKKILSFTSVSFFISLCCVPFIEFERFDNLFD